MIARSSQEALSEAEKTLAASSGDLLFDNRIICEWLDTKLAAAYLGITPNALRIMVHRDQIQAHKLGVKLRFKLRDLRSVLQRRRN